MSSQSSQISNQPLVKFDTNKISKDCCCYCLHIPTLPLELSDCGHSFCFTCVKEHKINNPGTFKCPLCRADIKDDIKHIKVDDPQKAISRYLNKPCWLYQSKDFQGWWMYEYYMNRRIEQLYQDDSSSQNNQFVLGVRPYNIDFTVMEQRDQKYQRYRKVQRLDDFKETDINTWKIRGIAGVYFEDKQ